MYAVMWRGWSRRYTHFLSNMQRTLCGKMLSTAGRGVGVVFNTNVVACKTCMRMSQYHINKGAGHKMNLIEGIQQEMSRVRELRKEYEKIGFAGAPGVALMDAALKAGDESIASGDVTRMLRVYARLKELE